MVKALVFDFDGLILDTEVPDFASWQELFDSHGATLEFETWAECIGTTDFSFDAYTHLEAQLGRAVDRAEVHARRRGRYLEMIAAESALPGVTDYLEDAKRLGLRLAVASSSDRAWVEGHLARLGLLAHFDATRCSDDVRRTKPDPELYLAAAAALGVPPEAAIAFEDSPNGVRAAKAAGMYCVAIPNALTRRLPLEHADLILPSLAELPLKALLTRLAEEVG
jgi:HAD superfamily hydrolase (TIGR01509 family)